MRVTRGATADWRVERRHLFIEYYDHTTKSLRCVCVFVKVMWVCARYMAAEDISLDSMPVDAERRERVWCTPGWDRL